MPTFRVCEEETRDSWGVAVAVAGKQSWELTGAKSRQVSRRMREWKVMERLRKNDLKYLRELAMWRLSVTLFCVLYSAV